jgi:hypothetical protein
MTPEGEFEADLETLKQWIAEGCVHSTDKVSKGNLNWIEAGRAPMLRPVFAGDVALPKPPAPEHPDPSDHFRDAPPDDDSPRFEPGVPADDLFLAGAPASTRAECVNHPNVAPFYVCRVCHAPFCRECPSFVGASKVPICPLCGDFCKPCEEETQKVVSRQFRSSAFGFADLGVAVGYPLKHPIPLFFGAIVYGVPLLGGLRGRAAALVLLFGCITRVVSQVAWGKLDQSFLPDFSEFSMWDDFFIPLGLGIGATLVTYGPILVLAFAVIFGALRGPGASLPMGNTSPGDKENARLSREDLAVLTSPDADPQKMEEANKKLAQLRPGYQINQEAKRSQEQESDPLAPLRLFMSYLRVSLTTIVLFGLALAWAFFYRPIALAVAGYTEDLKCVLNPVMGLDTIRRMGSTYWKAFFMIFLVDVIALGVGIAIAFITAPLAMPFFGNLPAKFLDGSITFYTTLVIACILGLALHKCADKLGIEID